MAKTFYLEIGTEEVPAGYIRPALEAMAQQMTRFMNEHRITCGEPATTGTPRRLCLIIPEVAETQQACTTEIVGPPKHVAFDASGQPTKAAEGFARNQGIGVDQLQIKATPKGEYVYVIREETGLPTITLLEKMLPEFVAHIPFPKSMRWGNLQVSFARPIHWIVALLGEDVISFQYGDVKSGNRSFGHRFMNPECLTVTTDFEQYKEQLRKHFVIVDYDERRKLIRDGIEEQARKVNGHVLTDDDLLDEVTQLVEYPYPLLGEFEKKYLELPSEVPITVMKEHQRYFAVIDDEGNLLPHFVTVANTIPRNPKLVAAGNARVIRARLEDARFYFEEDLKISLEQRAEELKGVVFHSKLGTSWEKVERFTELARWLAERLCPDRINDILRAALLCKADLVTGMVGEFPELQGIMGREYARRQGEPEVVSQAIYEHYLPSRAGGAIPERIEGTILSIADKIDTIVGCFSVGLIPTGTADPFALRRQTLGIIRIVLEKELLFSLEGLIDETLPLLSSKMTEPRNTVKRGVLDFFHGRLLHHLISRGHYDTDVVEAALSPGIDNLVQAAARVQALAAFKQRPDFDSLATAFKRVANIIKEPETTPVNSDLFKEEAERVLFEAVRKSEDTISDCLKNADFAGALETMTMMKEPIDGFFDKVLVMDKDETIRRNRLALLTSIQQLFSQLADFRKVQTA